MTCPINYQYIDNILIRGPLVKFKVIKFNFIDFLPNHSITYFTFDKLTLFSCAHEPISVRHEAG